MANRKISELTSRTPALSDLILVGDPSSGYSYKCTVTALATIIETDIADTYVTLGTTQTISGAKTFSNNLTLTSVANATITQTKFLTLNGSNVVNYRTGAEVLADIGGASSSSVSGTTNYLAKFTSSSAIGNSVIFESSGTIGINTTTPAGTIDISGVGGIALNGRRVINNSAADLFIGGLSGLPGVGTDTITFYTNNTSRATLNVSGNFGLGTSAPANILDIYNTNGFQNRIRITGTTNTSQLQFSNTGGDFYLGIDNSTASGFGVGGYSRVLYSSNAYPMVFFTNALERMRLDANGALLVGITSAYGDEIARFYNSSNAGRYVYVENPNTGISAASFVNVLAGAGADLRLGAYGTNHSTQANNATIFNHKATGSLLFGTVGSERMRLDASGNLGLGVSPASWYSTGYSALQVRGLSLYSAAGNDGNLVSNAYLSTAPAWTYLATGTATRYEQGSGSHQWFTAPSGTVGTTITFTERMRLDINGNLGLGVTPSAWSGMRAMDIGDGSFAISADGAGAGDGSLTWNGYYNGTNWIYKYTGGVATRYRQNESGHAWFYAPSGTAGTAISFTQAMTLDANGNLGLGVSSPSYKLDVVGTSRISTSSGENLILEKTAGAYLSFYNGSTLRASINGFNAVDGLSFNTGASHTTRMTLDASGNLGLGVSPSAWNSTFKALQVGTRTALTQGGANDLILGYNWYQDSGGTNRYIASSGANLFILDNQFKWLIAPSGVAGNSISFTQAMTLDASGRLGIGSTSPQTLLHIASANPILLWEETDQAVDAKRWGIQSETSIFKFRAFNDALSSAVDVMSMTRSGLVGIGTTSPTTKLHVSESSSGGAYLTLENLRTATFDGDYNGQILFKGNDTDGSGTRASIGALVRGVSGQTDLVFSTASAGASLAERMRITSGGAVGINTSSPDAGMALTLRESSTLSGALALINRNATKRYDLIIDVNSVDDGAFGIYDRTAGAYRQVITSAGNVGIGTSTPTFDDGTGVELSRSGIATYRATSTGSGTVAIEMKATTSAVYVSSRGNYPLGLETNGTERMRITSGGEVYIAGTTDQGAYNLQVNGTGVWGAGAYVNGSDSALKQNIQPLDNSLEIVKQMKPVTYTYKESYSKDTSVQTGFIAQDLQLLLKDKNYLNGIVKDGTYLSVAYQNLIPLLVKAIQEQQIEIEKLKNK